MIGTATQLKAKVRNLSGGDSTKAQTITPGAVEYSYKLMFEDRSISLWTYNLETLLAEKLETIMARGSANTRMRDFYDIHVISRQVASAIRWILQTWLCSSALTKPVSLPEKTSVSTVA